MNIPEYVPPEAPHQKYTIRRYVETEGQPTLFGFTSTPDLLERAEVWADAGLAAAFGAIPGVLAASTHGYETQYVLVFDPRYDAKWIVKEIEAVALCAEPVIKAEAVPAGSFTFSIANFFGNAVEEDDEEEGAEPAPTTEKKAKSKPKSRRRRT